MISKSNQGNQDSSGKQRNVIQGQRLDVFQMYTSIYVVVNFCMLLLVIFFIVERKVNVECHIRQTMVMNLFVFTLNQQNLEFGLTTSKR